MPQIQLPFFPPRAIAISPELACAKEDGRVVYFNGTMPVFSHAEGDMRSFRMITAMFCEHKTVRQADIVRAFKVPPLSVKRAVKTYRQSGVAGFFVERKVRGAAVLTADVLTRAQALFDQGQAISAVAEALGLKENTVRKAVMAGRLHRIAAKPDAVPVRTRSERSVQDAEAGMGMGATDEGGRVAASPAVDHLLVVAASDPRVVKELQVTTYHVLWELVHVFFEQPGVLDPEVVR